MTSLTLRLERLAAGVAGFAAISVNAITHGTLPLFDPIVDGAALHHHVAGLRCTLSVSSSMSISPEITTA